MAFLVLGFFVAATAAAWFVFSQFRLRLRMPWLLNVPGALFVWAATLQFCSWGLGDVFQGLAVSPPPPDVMLMSGIVFLGLSASFYAVSSAALLAWRAGSAVAKKRSEPS